MSKFAVVYLAARFLTSYNVEPVAQRYLTWLNAQADEVAAKSALIAAAATSKDPDRVLINADRFYDDTEGEIPSDGGGSPAASPQLQPDLWYYPISQSAYGTATVGNDYLRLAPFALHHETELAALGVNLNAEGDEAATFIAALYADQNGMPGDVVAQATLDVGNTEELNPYGAAAATLSPGIYWLGGVLQGSTTQPEFLTVNGLTVDIPVPMATEHTESWGLAGLEQGGVNEALPSPFASTGFTGLIPRIAIKTAA